MNFPRKAGILLHPTSLPGPWGIGDLGPEARRFAETLQNAGQTYWQVLPLNPTGYGASPYQSFSTFAGNSMMISFDDLLGEGLLKEDNLKDFPQFSEHEVDFEAVREARSQVLDSACRMFSRRASEQTKQQFESFCVEEQDWLDDVALYQALKQKYDGACWQDWPEALRNRDPEALAKAERSLASTVKKSKLLQFFFYRQWRALRWHAGECGVKLVGDIPIFVALDSADVWANPELFQLDEQGKPTVVAGVPPDYFSETGQLWGNPLYAWEAHQQDDYAWWMMRVRKTLEVVDIVRIDHFRGFEAYWAVPGDAETAMDGDWVKGPDHDFFDSMRRQMGDLPVIAEDLGIITDEVNLLRDDFELPGMRILQFSFIGDLKEHMRPDGFPVNSIVYTGTHDNDTTRGWFWREPGENTTETAEQIEEERHVVRSYLGTDGSQIQWDLISLAHRVASHTAIVPLQDVMGLGSEARMNMPGTAVGNWGWRFRWEDLHQHDLQRLRDITQHFGRL